MSLNLLENDHEPSNNKNLENYSSKNSSTLSLHISAYENFVEIADGGNDDEENAKFLKQNKVGGKTWKGLKKAVFGATSINSFEIPRQQNDSAPEPETMQFHAAQQLLNPNQADNDGFEVVKNTKDKKKSKSNDFMHISPEAVKCIHQHTCVSDVIEQSVTFNGKSDNIKYQVYGYPFGNDAIDFKKETSFNAVIQLVENPLNAVLKASYKFYFFDKNSKKHSFEGERIIDRKTTSKDIHLMDLAEFKDIMDTVGDGQKISFKISFTAVRELEPYLSQREDEPGKKFTSSFPVDILNIPNDFRNSPEYYFNGILFQFRLFMNGGEPWIDFQLLENPSRKKQNAKFDVKSSDHMLTTVEYTFGTSYRSPPKQSLLPPGKNWSSLLTDIEVVPHVVEQAV
uniref:Uncharacterized protein n=1 Tax=Panagrolaimus sp. ES5 TaxID=591445 RepID=A0AC34G192_9BILA